MQNRAGSDSAIIGAHLDLKGVQPGEEYLSQYLQDLADQGYNTLLVEYEDIFPFAKPIDVALDRPTVWSRRGLERFLTKAKQCGIEVIPLQQCLGHLEYVFRWPDYLKFAENKDYPATLRLGEPDAKAFIQSMLRQVLEAHPDSRYIHLGMDEAKHLAESPLVQQHGSVLKLYVAWLEELCDLVEEHGKTPVIWSDTIEDYYAPGSGLEALSERVVLMIWDYESRGERVVSARVPGGHRVSRAWQKRIGAEDAPVITSETKFIEDLPPVIRRALASYCRDGYWETFWQVDFFTRIGFRILGGTTVRKSSHGAVMPDYAGMFENMAAWADAITRNRQLGLVATSWERGTTFCPPNYNIDLSWPGLRSMSEILGAKPKPFWPGISSRQLAALLTKLSRCRQGWPLEATVLEEMGRLEPKLRGPHRHEWQSLRLMLQVSQLHKRLDFVAEEVDYFHADHRLPVTEYDRRLREQSEGQADLKELRRALQEHFRQRYRGKALDEWIRYLFDRHAESLKSCTAECRQRRAASKETYARGNR